MKPIYAILNFLLFYGSTQAQDILRPIKYLTTDNGLSQAINYSILKDSKELVWITSYDGLNKFDSRKITPYRNMLQDSTSFKGTLSMGLVEDENHNVWCGSNDELNVYIRNRNYFKHVNFNNTDNSLYIPLISYSNNILFKKGDNLFTCDINTYQIKKITVALPEELLKYTPKVFESNSSFYIFFYQNRCYPALNLQPVLKYWKLKNDFTKAHIIYKQTDANQYHDVIDLNNGNYILGTNNGLLNLILSLMSFCLLPRIKFKK
ncbi:MAG: hypothetical protein IPP48_02440 [Chitinophagaceae bacterium]|nr:hypothetical protein [Chitinophagaceae bacterium]